MIILQNVSHSRSLDQTKTPLLKNCDLVIGGCERIGIFAEAGAGKSTLARIFSGIETPQLGQVIHHGRVSWPIGQAGIVHPNLTLAQNIHTLADISGIDREEALIFCLALCRFTSFRNILAKRLSPTQRTIFAFGLGLMVPVQHYIFDDKFLVGDTEMQNRFYQFLNARCATSGIVLISRNKRILEENCNRFFQLTEGSLVETPDISQTLNERAHA